MMIQKTAQGGFTVNMELYENTQQMVNDLKTRSITSTCFHDMPNKDDYDSWDGVKSYNECLEYIANGYQPTVDALKESVKPTIKGEAKRMSFNNNVAGFMPIVPLAMMNVPNSMIDMHIKPIKAKVLDVYYDITCTSSVKSSDIIEAGQKVLATIMKLEQQGYKFNLYAIQAYNDFNSSDMLVVKVKSSNQPLDLRRMSYMLTHTSAFRVLGFDWYSKNPKAKYRSGYGNTLINCIGENRTNELIKQIFGKNALYLAANMITKTRNNNAKDEYINNVINVK